MVITALLILGCGVATILVASIALRNPESKIFVGSAKTAKVYLTLFCNKQNLKRMLLLEQWLL